MDRRSAQAPSAVIMIRPHHFSPNKQTQKDNAFQQSAENLDQTALAKSAYDEATNVAKKLEELNIKVHVFEDEGTSFTKQHNNMLLFACAESFLAKHLGGSREI